MLHVLTEKIPTMLPTQLKQITISLVNGVIGDLAIFLSSDEVRANFLPEIISKLLIDRVCSKSETS